MDSGLVYLIYYPCKGKLRCKVVSNSEIQITDIFQIKCSKHIKAKQYQVSVLSFRLGRSCEEFTSYKSITIDDTTIHGSGILPIKFMINQIVDEPKFPKWKLTHFNTLSFPPYGDMINTMQLAARLKSKMRSTVKRFRIEKFKGLVRKVIMMLKITRVFKQGMLMSTLRASNVVVRFKSKLVERLKKIMNEPKDLHRSFFDSMRDESTSAVNFNGKLNHPNYSWFVLTYSSPIITIRKNILIDQSTYIDLRRFVHSSDRVITISDDLLSEYLNYIQSHCLGRIPCDVFKIIVSYLTIGTYEVD